MCCISPKKSDPKYVEVMYWKSIDFGCLVPKQNYYALNTNNRFLLLSNIE